MSNRAVGAVSLHIRLPKVDEYIFRKQYEKVNALDDIRMGDYEIHVYDKTQKAYLKWREEGPDGTELLKEDQHVEAKLSDTCAVCKGLQE